MNLQEQYDAMRKEACAQIVRGAAEIDMLIDSEEDQRRGITLLVRPPAFITHAIEEILAAFQRIEPTQYYYPATDIHLTILSIISCYPDFKLAMIDSSAYTNAVHSILQNVRPFRIVFSGLSASPGGIIVQGTPTGKELESLRHEIRKVFQQSGLQQTIDQRYSIRIAHLTIIRFKNPLLHPNQLIETIHKYQRHPFGSFEVNALELVYNDWYQRADKTVLLEKFTLNK